MLPFSAQLDKKAQISPIVIFGHPVGLKLKLSHHVTQPYRVLHDTTSCGCYRDSLQSWIFRTCLFFGHSIFVLGLAA